MRGSGVGMGQAVLLNWWWLIDMMGDYIVDNDLMIDEFSGDESGVWRCVGEE